MDRLTGTGSDGAEGAREVKAAGGMVVIEDPATAAFAGMPRSLAPTTVDVMAHLDQIGPLLHDLLAGTYLPRPLDPAGAGRQAEEDVDQHDLLATVLVQLRERSGIDFTSYRRPTILRRLQRRMAATKLPRLDDHWIAEESRCGGTDGARRTTRGAGARLLAPAPLSTSRWDQ